MKPEEKTDWERLIKSAKTPQEKAEVLKKIVARADKELRAKGLSDAEREALVAEIMYGDDEDA